jgi:hypothetical protein
MDTHVLRQLLKQALAGYVKPAFNGYTFLTTNPKETQFVVTGISNTRHGRVVNSAIIVQLMDDAIVIEQDINDKPLVDDLQGLRILREQIILAYRGEPLPDKSVPLMSQPVPQGA